MARPDKDSKIDELRASRCLNPKADRVTDRAFVDAEFFDARDIVQVKYEMVRRVRIDGDAVSETVRRFGLSRPSFYEAASALDTGGLAAFVPARPGPRKPHKLTAEIVAYAADALAEDPSLRSIDLVHSIEARFDIRVHPRSVERALARSKESER